MADCHILASNSLPISMCWQQGYTENSVKWDMGKSWCIMLLIWEYFDFSYNSCWQHRRQANSPKNSIDIQTVTSSLFATSTEKQLSSTPSSSYTQAVNVCILWWQQIDDKSDNQRKCSTSEIKEKQPQKEMQDYGCILYHVLANSCGQCNRCCLFGTKCSESKRRGWHQPHKWNTCKLHSCPG